MNINVDKYYYTSKEEAKKHMGMMSNVVSNNIIDLDLNEIVKRVGKKGCTFTRAVVDGGTGDDRFVQQRFLVLDFDGTIEMEEFRKRCEEYRVPFLFTYKTFRWREEDNRFRAVFLMDRWISNPGLAKAANYMLDAIFPEVDSSCVNLGRMFLGGKGVIEKNLDARINVVELAREMEIYYRVTKGRNYSTDLKNFGKRSGIKVSDGRLCIFYDTEFNSEGIEDKIIDNGIIMLPYRKEQNCDVYSVKEREIKETRPMLTSFDSASLCKLCALFRDFINGKDLHHDLEFLLATNLINIKGGRQLFEDNMKKMDKLTPKWKYDLKRMSLKGYKPEQCIKSKVPCPYYDKCKANSLYTKASQKIRKLESTEDFYEIEKCEADLREFLENAIDAKDSNIHVIKAQTALGKTEQYAEIVKNRADKKFLIAASTIKLQHELAERIEAKGVKCEITESIYTKATQLPFPGLTEELDWAFSQGFAKRAKRIVSAYRNEHQEELSAEQLKKLDGVLKKQEIVYSGARCIVTTHALFLMKELYRMKEYEIIIDEDLLMTLFHLTGSLPVATVKNMLNYPLLVGDNQELLREILKLHDGETLRVNFMPLSEKALDILYWHRKEFAGPVPKLFESTHVIMRKDKQEIVFIRKNDFLDSNKLTILSATADRTLYRDYFSGKKVYFRETHNAEYKGKLIQYTAHPLSRVYFKQNGMMDIVKQIQDEYIKDIPIISFKMLFPDSEIHFGKTEGFNIYKGMDIAVIGTPHNSPILYKLVGAMLGYSTSDSLHKYRVERKGVSYTMMTYGDEEMRNLQFFFIESELEQAVGRARLLREDCTVYVFSNYPCQQAELVQDSYLKVQTEVDAEKAEEDTVKDEDEVNENESLEY